MTKSPLLDITKMPRPRGLKKFYDEIIRTSKPPRTKTNEELRSREFLTEDEVKSIRKAVRTYSKYPDRDEAIILIMFRHGLRLRELANLKWDQIDLRGNLMHVKRIKNGLPSTHPIGGEELRLLRKLNKKDNRQKHIFISRNNLPIGGTTLNTIVKKAGEWAKLEFPIHPHMLRHACGYYLANKGIDTRSIQVYMGHRNIQSTVIYTQLDPSRFQDFWED